MAEFSPPNCFHDLANPKCYSPRCLCMEGFVRSPSGHCIRPTRCPNRYSEPEVRRLTAIGGPLGSFMSPFGLCFIKTSIGR